MSNARERMKQLREYRRKSQADFAELLGISQQSYSKKERERAEGGNDGFSPDDFVRILEATEIDARWLFGQLQGPIEGADLRISGGKTDAAEMHEVVSEYRAWKDSLSKKDSLSQRLQSDPELLECVELMIRHRGEVSRVRGYIDRMTEDRSRLGQREADQKTAGGGGGCWDGPRFEFLDNVSKMDAIRRTPRILKFHLGGLT